MKVPTLSDLPKMCPQHGLSLPLDFQLCRLQQSKVFHAVSALYHLDLNLLLGMLNPPRHTRIHRHHWWRESAFTHNYHQECCFAGSTCVSHLHHGILYIPCGTGFCQLIHLWLLGETKKTISSSQCLWRRGILKLRSGFRDKFMALADPSCASWIPKGEWNGVGKKSMRYLCLMLVSLILRYS